MGIIGMALEQFSLKKKKEEVICYKINVVKSDIEIVLVNLFSKESVLKVLGDTYENIIFMQLSGKRFGLIANIDSDVFLMFRASKDDPLSWCDVLEEDYRSAEYITQL